jgi:hypothetical protein
MRRIGIAAFILLGFVLPVHAADQGFNVASCGTPTGQTYTIPGFGPLTVDQNGNLCVNTSGGGGLVTANITQFGGTNISTGTGIGGAGIPRVTVSSDSFPASQTVTGAVNVTATDCSGTITSGGTAQNAFAAQTTLHGFTIANIDTTEPLWISFTTTAAASGAGSYPLPAATATTFAGFGSFTAPPGFGLNHALSVIAATTSHKFTCTWW